MNETERLREYYEASQAVERGVVDFDLHHDAVLRLRRALDAVREIDGQPPMFPELKDEGHRPVTVSFREDARNDAHVRVSVFAGRNEDARGRSGELVFRTDEWDELWPRLKEQGWLRTTTP